MPTNLLNQYIEIAKLLMEYGPHTTEQINSSFKNLDPTSLKRSLDFFTKNKMISQQTQGAISRYTLTERGVGVLSFFKIVPSGANIN
jgi:hypothetical protein